MPGLGKANEWISRDEGLHTQFACHVLTHYIVNKPDEKTVHQIIKEAFDIEIEFCTESLPVGLLGMNAKLMIQYVQFVGNQLLSYMGYRPLWEQVNNPFPWMEALSLSGKTNFFEQPVSEYQRLGIEKEENDIFNFSDNF